MNNKFLLLLMVVFVGNLSVFATSGLSIKTFMVDASSQPPLVGAIVNGDTSKVISKGFIVSSNSEKNTLNDAVSSTGDKSGWNGLPVNCSNYDCSNLGGEEFTCRLNYLLGNTTYYVRSYIVTQDSVCYGNTLTLKSGNFNRCNTGKRMDYANVWYAFSYTLFDLISDEIIEPSTDGFYYSTNENPTHCGFQKGTSYNTCYKYKTKWNYQLWYNGRFTLPTKPVMSLSGDKLSISAQDGTTIYYSVNGDGLRPENFTETYSEPITVKDSDVIYCYAMNSNNYASYVNTYKVLSTSGLKGSGTVESPYLIGTADELKTFNELLANNSKLCGRLTADITLNENVLDGNYNLNGDDRNFEQWECHSIAGGHFNGAGHKISGLYINNDKEYQSLFGNASDIDSLGVVDSYIKARRHVAGITIWLGNGDGKGGVVSNCYFDGVVIATSDKAGGIAAHMGNGYEGGLQNKIINCYNKGKISGYNHVGGICGSAYSLTSYDDDYIENCYNVGQISASWTDCGAICGYADNAVGSKVSASASKCYYLSGSCTKQGQGYMGEAKSETNFSDGTVCQLLNGNGGNFHQNIGYDSYPTLFGKDGNSQPTEMQCATPVVILNNGKISFFCETDGAVFHALITSSATSLEGQNISMPIQIPKTYTVEVYATAYGYLDSERIKAVVTIDPDKFNADVNKDGLVNISDVNAVISVMCGK